MPYPATAPAYLPCRLQRHQRRDRAAPTSPATTSTAYLAQNPPWSVLLTAKAHRLFEHCLPRTCGGTAAIDGLNCCQPDSPRPFRQLLSNEAHAIQTLVRSVRASIVVTLIPPATSYSDQVAPYIRYAALPADPAGIPLVGEMAQQRGNALTATLATSSALTLAILYVLVRMRFCHHVYVSSMSRRCRFLY